MASRRIWDVEPRDDGKWAVRREGSKRAGSVHERKGDAVSRASALGARNQGQIRIKGADGRIRDERTFTRDPYPPKG